MKKRIKLFSSALAIGMLLGTGVGSLSAVTQQEPGTTAVAKADTRAGASVTLENHEMIVNDGVITGVRLSEDREADLVNGGILTIPANYYTDPDDSETAIPITGIGNSVFSKFNLGGNWENEGIKKVIFENPQNIIYIGNYAFNNNGLTEVDLSHVKTIGNFAFSNNQLTNVDLTSAEDIGDEAFNNNQLTNVDLTSAESIGNAAFENNQLTNVELSKLKTIGPYTFYNNKLTNIDLTNVEIIGSYAFENNGLTSVDLPNIKTIGYSAFSENKIKTILINEGHPHNSNAELGTVENPQIEDEAFGSQYWNEMQLSYQSTISYQNLVEELGLVFKINGNDYLNEMRFKGSMDIDDAHNIDYSDEDQEIIVTSEEGGDAYVRMNITDKSQEDSPAYLYGWLGLAVNAKDGGIVPNPPVPGPEDNNKPDTSNPDTGDNGSGNNNGNETKPQPAPKPEERRPHTVYAKRGMRLHRNVSLTSPIRSYKKQSRAKAANFRVRGIAYDRNGKKRYKVDGGYITAGASYVADSHFRSNKVRQVRVLSNRVNSYKDVKLSSNKKVRSYKKGTKLRVKRVVNWGRATRFELTNGRYITGNKQLLIMDQK